MIMSHVYPKLLGFYERHRFLMILAGVVAVYLVVAWTTGLCTVCGVISRVAGASGAASCAP